MKQWWSVPVALGLWLGAGAAAWAEGCGISTMDIPVRIVDSRPIATMTLNGTEVSLLVDSGAFFSMLTLSTAKQLNLPLRDLPFGFWVEGYTGSIDAQLTRVAKVGLRGTELSKVDFIVGGNELGAGIQGILGRNILAMADTEYDLAHGVIRLVLPKGDCEKSNMAYWAGQAPVIAAPLETSGRRRDTAIQVNVAINGKTVLALLDTGAPDTSLTLRAAKDAGMNRSTFVPAGRIGGAGEGRVSSWFGMVDTFEIGGEKVRNSRLRVNDTNNTEEGLLVGLDYFLSHRIYVARRQRMLYATWNGNSIFAGPGQGVVTDEDRQRYAATPQALADDDADGLARRGAAAAAAGNFPAALADLNRACELAPTVASHFLDRANVHQSMKQPRLALADLDTALKLDPTQDEARTRRAALRVSVRDRASALEDLAALNTSLAPSAHQRAAMAEAYVRLAMLPQAFAQWELWVSHHEADARLADVLNTRCWLRARKGMDLPLALADCKRAVAMDKGSAVYKDRLAWTYLRQGDATQAKEVFDAALALQPKLVWALYGRGLAQQTLKDAAAGQQDLDAARRLRPQIDADVRRAGFSVAADAPPPTPVAASAPGSADPAGTTEAPDKGEAP